MQQFISGKPSRKELDIDKWVKKVIADTLNLRNNRL